MDGGVAVGVKVNSSGGGSVHLVAPATASDVTLELPTDSVQPGLVLVAAQSGTGVSSISVNNCFTSKYINYRLVFYSTVATSVRLRAGGVDNSSLNYSLQYHLGSASASTAGRSTSQAQWDLGGGGTFAIEISSPAAAANTQMMATAATGGGSPAIATFAGYHAVASAFDGVSLLGTSMTGAIYVYGYRNSITT